MVASLMVRLAFFRVVAEAGVGTVTTVPFFAAHLAFCAAAIFAFVAALKVRRPPRLPVGAATVELPPPSTRSMSFNRASSFAFSLVRAVFIARYLLRSDFMLMRSQAGRDWKRKDRVSDRISDNLVAKPLPEGRILLTFIFRLRKSIFVLFVSLSLASCGCR